MVMSYCKQRPNRQTTQKWRYSTVSMTVTNEREEERSTTVARFIGGSTVEVDTIAGDDQNDTHDKRPQQHPQQ